MANIFERTAMLLGEDAIEKLSGIKVAIFGVGGVGGFIAEAIARSGVGAIDLFDNDTVSASNINRQIIALHSTIGKYKTDVMKERILDINPNCKVGAYNLFYGIDTANSIDLSQYDYVADAIDSVKSKVLLIVKCKEANVPIISAMGAGNKLNPWHLKLPTYPKQQFVPLQGL